MDYIDICINKFCEIENEKEQAFANDKRSIVDDYYNVDIEFFIESLHNAEQDNYRDLFYAFKSGTSNKSLMAVNNIVLDYIKHLHNLGVKI